MLDDKGINNDYATSNTFFNGLTKTSQTQMQASAQQANPVLESLDPAVFQVAAKKNSLMWHSQQYRDKEQRDTLTQTTNKSNF